MADSYIQVAPDSTGKKMQTVENTVSGNSVHAEAVLLVDANGVPIGSPSLPTGAATEAKQDTQITDLGGVTETAPASDTASSGLNGRLQRIAQRITSFIALFPSSIGSKTKALSLSVTLASDDDATGLLTAINATAGIANGAAVTTDANGTLQQYLRGLVKMWSDGTALTPSTKVITTQRPAITEVRSTAFEASHVLKASAGQLVQLTVFNSKASAQFILLINATSLPSNGAVSLLYPPIPIAAATILVLDLPAPLIASTGIVVANSSTGTFSLTTGSADCAFYAQVN